MNKFKHSENRFNILNKISKKKLLVGFLSAAVFVTAMGGIITTVAHKQTTSHSIVTNQNQQLVKLFLSDEAAAESADTTGTTSDSPASGDSIAAPTAPVESSSPESPPATTGETKSGGASTASTTTEGGSSSSSPAEASPDASASGTGTDTSSTTSTDPSDSSGGSAEEETPTPDATSPGSTTTNPPAENPPAVEPTPEPAVPPQAATEVKSSYDLTNNNTNYGSASFLTGVQFNGVLENTYHGGGISQNLSNWSNDLIANSSNISSRNAFSQIIGKIININLVPGYAFVNFVDLNNNQNFFTNSIIIDPIKATVEIRDLKIQTMNVGSTDASSSSSTTPITLTVPNMKAQFQSTYTTNIQIQPSQFFHSNNFYGAKPTQLAYKINQSPVLQSELMRYVRYSAEDSIGFVKAIGDDVHGNIYFEFKVPNFYENGAQFGERLVFTEVFSGFWSSLPIILGVVIPLGTIALLLFSYWLWTVNKPYRRLFASRWNTWQKNGRYAGQHAWLKRVSLQRRLHIKRPLFLHKKSYYKPTI